MKCSLYRETTKCHLTDLTIKKVQFTMHNSFRQGHFLTDEAEFWKEAAVISCWGLANKLITYVLENWRKHN
jgi:hypothetical protein